MKTLKPRGPLLEGVIYKHILDHGSKFAFNKEAGCYQYLEKDNVTFSGDKVPSKILDGGRRVVHLGLYDATAPKGVTTHHFFKKAKDLREAEEDLKGTIERIAAECDIDVYINFSVIMSLVSIWDGTAEFSIKEDCVHKLVRYHPDLPITKGFDRLQAKLKDELENEKLEK